VAGYNSSDEAKHQPSAIALSRVALVGCVLIASARSIVLTEVSQFQVANQIRAINVSVRDSALTVAPWSPCDGSPWLCRAPARDSFGYHYVGQEVVGNSYIGAMELVNATNVAFDGDVDDIATMPAFVDLRAEAGIDFNADTPSLAYVFSNVTRNNSNLRVVCPPTMQSVTDQLGLICRRCPSSTYSSSNGTTCVPCPAGTAAVCGRSPDWLCPKGHRKSDSAGCVRCESGVVWNGMFCDCPANTARVPNYQAEGLGLLTCASLEDTCSNGIVVFDIECLTLFNGLFFGGIALALAVIVGCAACACARRRFHAQNAGYNRLVGTVSE